MSIAHNCTILPRVLDDSSDPHCQVLRLHWQSRLIAGVVLTYSAVDGHYSLDPSTQINVPFLFIQHTDDVFLPVRMSEGMEKYIPNLRRAEADCKHFSLVLAPDTINKHIVTWLGEDVEPGL